MTRILISILIALNFQACVQTQEKVLLEKAGFVFEARLKNAIFRNGEFMDELIYSKLNQ